MKSKATADNLLRFISVITRHKYDQRTHLVGYFINQESVKW